MYEPVYEEVYESVMGLTKKKIFGISGKHFELVTGDDW